MKKYIHPDLHFVFPVVRKTKSPVSDEYLTEWRQLLTQGSYFNMEDWYSEMGIEDNTQAAIYTEESVNILRKLNLKSFESDYKIMVIWLPEKMNPECSNKLLKIVEEPFDKTLFLMVSEHPEQIINTIQSRTQRINIPLCKKRKLQNNSSGKKGSPMPKPRNMPTSHQATGTGPCAY